mmetsp:Transcript_51338/g.111766  ORF Transcript_51338/g.111766 Transcript_51338/m.111766 type:complete len:420 (-) Transcript_51338:299-1558(-)
MHFFKCLVQGIAQSAGGHGLALLHHLLHREHRRLLGGLALETFVFRLCQHNLHHASSNVQCRKYSVRLGLRLGIDQKMMAGKAHSILHQCRHLCRSIHHTGAGGQGQCRHQKAGETCIATPEPFHDFALPWCTLHKRCEDIVLGQDSLHLIIVQDYGRGAAAADQGVHGVRQRHLDVAERGVAARDDLCEARGRGCGHCGVLHLNFQLGLCHHCPLFRRRLFTFYFFFQFHGDPCVFFFDWSLFFHFPDPFLFQPGGTAGHGVTTGTASSGFHHVTGRHQANHVASVRLCGQQGSAGSFSFESTTGAGESSAGANLWGQTTRPGRKPLPSVQGLTHLLVKRPKCIRCRGQAAHVALFVQHQRCTQRRPEQFLQQIPHGEAHLEPRRLIDWLHDICHSPCQCTHQIFAGTLCKRLNNVQG